MAGNFPWLWGKRGMAMKKVHLTALFLLMFTWTKAQEPGCAPSEDSLVVCPNPVTEHRITINIPARPLNTTLLHLYSEGKCVYTTALNGRKNTIQLPPDLHGIYLLEVVSGNDRMTKKLVIEQ